jgi:diguanylate cyclase (GGDEF)-like protein
MAVSFRSRLLASFVFLIGFSLLTTTWAVLRAVDNNARANANRELLVAQRVFETLLDENSRQLTDRTALLADDFGFRQAIATNEDDTVISTLANHGERISADMIFLMSPAGEVLIGTHDLSESLLDLRQQMTSLQQPFNDLTIAEGQPFQLVMVPVKAPELIAWVGVGFVMDVQLINSFKEITKADVSLLYQGSSDSSSLSLSTLTFAQNRKNNEGATFEENLVGFTDALTIDGWLNQQSSMLDRGNQKMTLVLSVSLQEAIGAYNKLQAQMLTIAAIILLLAVIASVFIAGTVTQPIGSLMKAARRIALGDYEQRLAISGKTEFSELGETLNQMQADIQEREQRISFQAQHDMLTGLPNRHFLAELFQERMAVYSSDPMNTSQLTFMAILIKITNFDSLSDVYGNSLTDRVLKLAANRLSNSVRKGDTVGSIATDELLVFSKHDNESSKQELTDYLTELFSKSFHENEIEITFDIRLGVVMCPFQADSFEDVLRRSNIALNQARLENVACQFFDVGMEEQYLRTLRVTQRLQHAIAEQKFTLLFQPQYDLKHQKIHSAEALIRWHDEELGQMFPDEFIPLAESSGDITLITDWVFDEALAQLNRWHAAGFELGVSINLSAKDILKDDFIDRVVNMIKSQDIDPSLLMLEVTESAFVEDMEHALLNLKRLYDAGAQLAMDDFGTGFSSLAQLKVMPVHELKIDKSFVLKLDNDLDDQKIVRSTIEMAHHLGLSVIAEGVENSSSLELLKNMHCDAIQGYFLSKPMSSEDLTTWLSEFKVQQLESTHA